MNATQPTGPIPDRLHDVRFGDAGPPLAFCHGLFGQGRNWTTLAKTFAHDHQVVLLDMPNHGRSPATQRIDYRDLADLVADHLASISTEPWRLVGHSMGGKIAMMVALTRPALVERLCVVDMSPVSYATSREIDGYATAMQAIDLDALATRGDADRHLRSAVPNDAIRGFLLQNLRQNHGSWQWQVNLDLLAASLAELAAWPEVSGSFTGPVLWVAGAESQYVRPEYAAQMRSYFPATRALTIKNAGHWVHSEQPDVFGAALRHFLDDASTQ